VALKADASRSLPSGKTDSGQAISEEMACCLRYSYFPNKGAKYLIGLLPVPASDRDATFPIPGDDPSDQNALLVSQPTQGDIAEAFSWS
jgi:hypothetical protein